MEISAKVLRVIQEEGIPPAELTYMVEHAAISSIRTCNGKYFHWCFQLVGNQVLDMQRVEVLEVGHGTLRQTEEQR